MFNKSTSSPVWNLAKNETIGSSGSRATEARTFCSWRCQVGYTNAIGKKLFRPLCWNVNQLWCPNCTVLFWKSHNVDSERLYKSISLCKLSESRHFSKGSQRASRAHYRLYFDTTEENRKIIDCDCHFCISSINFRALFRRSVKSSERPMYSHLGLHPIWS